MQQENGSSCAKQLHIACLDFFDDGTAAVIYSGSDCWRPVKYRVYGDKIRLIMNEDKPYTLYYDKGKGSFLCMDITLYAMDKNEFATWIQLKFEPFTLRVALSEYPNHEFFVVEKTE